MEEDEEESVTIRSYSDTADLNVLTFPHVLGTLASYILSRVSRRFYSVVINYERTLEMYCDIPVRLVYLPF